MEHVRLCHCEAQSAEAISALQSTSPTGLLRFARNDTARKQCGTIINMNEYTFLPVPAVWCIVVAPSLLRESSELKRIKASFKPSLPGWRGQKASGKVLSIILISTIAGAIGALGYVITAPNVGEKSTEFYILGPEGRAQNYPTELIVGKEGRVIVGIINREHEEATYRVEIVVNGVKSSDLKPVTLEHNEKWEKLVSFALDKPGGDQKVEFLLYRLDHDEVYHRVHLWIDAAEEIGP